MQFKFEIHVIYKKKINVIKSVIHKILFIFFPFLFIYIFLFLTVVFFGGISMQNRVQIVTLTQNGAG